MTRRPVVVLVAHEIHDHGGMERAGYQLVRCLHERVRFVVVACSLATELHPMVERWIRIRVPERPFPAKFCGFYVHAGRAIRQLCDADLIHTVGAIIPNRADVASIHFCHAGFVATTGRLAPTGPQAARRINTGLSRLLALAAEHWGYRPTRLRACAAVSEGVAEELSRHYPGIPIVITPNGVDADQFFPDLAVRRMVRAKEQVEEDIVALFVGGDWDRKGLDVAIEALALARDQGLLIRLWIVGLGDQRRFMKQATSLGVDRVVRFWGPQNNVSHYYQAADLFVLPSLYETFSLVALEAAATGLPLIVTSSSGLGPAIAGAGQGGRIVERTPASVAAALLELGLDPGLRHEVGEEARRRARVFSWQQSAEVMWNLYESLLPGNTDLLGMA